MQREVEIYAEDVYRAKTEKEFHAGIFFEEVYKRTDAIVCDIIEQMRFYAEDSRVQGGYKAKYHGMGNNIVAFCADRGQGKTSAMQSYAAYLQNNDIAKDNFFGTGNVIGRSYFKVLDPIDPSALDSGESIIRVLVSRLFLEFSKMTEENKLPFKDEIKFRKEKDNILKAFERCYENIDYLQKEKNIEAYDLETLAQLGNSAELKKNLYNLVEYFLDVVFCEKEERRPAYLVVQVDDADLSMGDIFKICDDIRNYFSIPNIIVMMATNYKQLEVAISQRYMKQYECIIRLQEQRGFVEECSRMAFRYLEKMLPAGHRVMLTSIDALINANVNHFTVLYYRNNAFSKIGKADVFKTEIDVDCRCRNIQQQLMKFLYMKTGIVLLERPGEMCSVLPHTLRELTHFVKLLDDMEQIDQKRALKVWAGAGDIAEVEKWKRNLDILKRYFLNYWCGTHLNCSQQIMIEEIDRCNRKMDLVYQSINQYIKSHDGKELSVDSPYSYSVVMKECVETGLASNPLLQDAVIFYYTIVLNEWFVQSIGDAEKAGSLAGFLGKPFDVKMVVEDGSYNILQFDFSAENLRQYAEGELTNALNRAWLKAFCIADGDSSFVDEERVIRNVEGRAAGTKVQFNLFHPILTMLYSDIWRSQPDERLAEQDSASVSDYIEDGNRLNDHIDMSYLISAKNLLVNYDVQSWVRIRVEEKMKEWDRSGERRLDRIWRSYYTLRDSWENACRYLGEESILSQVCFGEYFENAVLGNIIFLCNEENRKKYVKVYKEHLLHILDMMIDRMTGIIKLSKYDEMEVAAKQMIGDAKSSSVNSEIVMPLDEQKGSSQFVQRIPELRALVGIERKIELECYKLSILVEENESIDLLRQELEAFSGSLESEKAKIQKVSV